MQSFGSFSPPQQPQGARQWTAAREALVAIGERQPAPTGTTRAKRYAFFGGPPLTRRDVAQSNSSIVADPTVYASAKPARLAEGERAHAPGRLLHARRGARPSDGPADWGCYETVFNTSKPWPYTAEAGEPQRSHLRDER